MINKLSPRKLSAPHRLPAAQVAATMGALSGRLDGNFSSQIETVARLNRSSVSGPRRAARLGRSQTDARRQPLSQKQLGLTQRHDFRLAQSTASALGRRRLGSLIPFRERPACVARRGCTPLELPKNLLKRNPEEICFCKSLIYGAPYGIRTRVTALRGLCPGPLDDGSGAEGPA